MKTKLFSIVLLLMFFVVGTAFAQNVNITGTVTDEGGDPLIGVTILVKGTTSGALTDLDGKYSISANSGDVLIFSYTGQKTEERTVGNATVMNVTLAEETSLLGEVVVIAYGEQSRKKLVQSVSTITNENIKDIPAVAPQELLQGQASGVQVVNSSGILGAAPVIKIRGVASISSGGRPLIVIDGVPMNDANQTTGQGGQALNPLGDINPNDIESFSVLKDAAATAVYGSRGANGVVLITTKSGKKNSPTRITLDMTQSFTESTDIIEMMNADQFRQFRIESGAATPGSDPQTSFDWPSQVVRTGNSQNINVGISGGSAKTSFFVGGTYADQEGFIVGNNLKRASGRINLNHDATDWLQLGVNIGVTSNRNDRVGSENNTFAPLTSSFLQTPWVEAFDANGNYTNTGFIRNVIAIEDLNINDANSFRTVGNAFARVDLGSLLDGLSFRTSFGVDRVLLEEFSRGFDVISPGGTARNYYGQQNKYVFNNTFTYAKTFGDFHDLNLTAGMAYEQTDIRDITVSGNTFLSDRQINVVSAATPETTQNTVTGNRLVGYLARFNYSYKNKYIVEGSVRRDGSSRFGVNNQYGTFWSAGGAWLLSEEDFLSDVSWLNSLKLRANYGTAGNDRIGDFASLENFEGGVISNYNGAAGLRQLAAANPNLQWERSQSYNIGLEASIFSNRLTVAVDVYNKRTTDLLLNVPIPQTNGGLNSILQNVGEMENRGVDLDITSTNISTPDFEWTTSLNMGFNTNEVLSLPGANTDSEGRQFVTGSANQRAIVGHSVNSFYLIPYIGVNPQTGDAEWLSAEGTPTTSPTSGDRVIVGDANPDFVGGIRNTFKYKAFDLNVFMNFSYGNEIAIGGLRFTENPTGTFNKSTRLLDVWRQPGDNAYLPSYDSPTFNTFAQRSSAQVLDGSFLRLRNVTLGYTLPASVTDRIGVIKGARFYATANNIFTIKADGLEGIDPEVTDSIANTRQGESFFTPPQAQTLLFGIRLTF